MDFFVKNNDWGPRRYFQNQFRSRNNYPKYWSRAGQGLARDGTLRDEKKSGRSVVTRYGRRDISLILKPGGSWLRSQNLSGDYGPKESMLSRYATLYIIYNNIINNSLYKINFAFENEQGSKLAEATFSLNRISKGKIIDRFLATSTTKHF